MTRPNPETKAARVMPAVVVARLRRWAKMKRASGVAVLLVLAIVLVLSIGTGLRRLPTAKERKHVFRVGFSHPAITEKVGAVRNVSIALQEETSVFGKRGQDWSRSVSSDIISGTVRLRILGTTEGGFVTLSYTLRTSGDDFSVVRIDTSALGTVPQTPNKAPEPTP